MANVARRAGLGTTILAAVNAIGRLPDFYLLAADNLETLPRLQLFEEIKGMDQQ